MTEVGLSLTLLVGAGLLLRSFAALRGADLGVRTENVFVAALPLPPDRYPTGREVTGFLRPLLARLNALPGVVEAGASNTVPPYGGDESRVEVAGGARGEECRALVQQVSEGYFRVLRLQFRRGRPPREEDVEDARRVAVVNETFARRYLPDGDPLGRRVRVARLDEATEPAREAWLEIVGVVGDVANRGGVGPVEPEVWIPNTLMAPPVQVLMVRTTRDPGAVANALRRELWAMDSGLALWNSRTLQDWIDERLYVGPRFGSVVMALFGGIGLVLVTVGVYSVLSYSTERKTHEIGLRIALGARGADVVGMVVGSGLRLVALGVAVGLTMSLVLGRTIGSQLVGVTAYDPPTLAAAAALLGVTAAIAAWIPARKAAGVDPLVALRHE